MTTNLAECMNFVLKEARILPITALVKVTFSKINVLFVTPRFHKIFIKVFYLKINRILEKIIILIKFL